MASNNVVIIDDDKVANCCNVTCSSCADANCVEGCIKGSAGAGQMIQFTDGALNYLRANKLDMILENLSDLIATPQDIVVNDLNGYGEQEVANQVANLSQAEFTAFWADLSPNVTTLAYIRSVPLPKAVALATVNQLGNGRSSLKRNTKRYSK